MRISPRGLEALPALTVLAQHSARIVKNEPITAEENLSKKVLRAILLELVRVRSLGSMGGANGRYQSKESPKKTSLGPVISGIDDPPAPFDDQESRCGLINIDWQHRALVRILLDVRNASGNTLDHTFLSDLGCCRRN
jgi:DNA-binding IscR family transcriptional regulator